jgi:hypothetical protein
MAASPFGMSAPVPVEQLTALRGAIVWLAADDGTLIGPMVEHLRALLASLEARPTNSPPGHDDTNAAASAALEETQEPDAKTAHEYRAPGVLWGILELNPPQREDVPRPTGEAIPREIERAYGCLWREIGDAGLFVFRARRLLLSVLDKEAQKRGIAWALEHFGEPNPEEANDSIGPRRDDPREVGWMAASRALGYEARREGTKADVALWFWTAAAWLEQHRRTED